MAGTVKVSTILHKGTRVRLIQRDGCITPRFRLDESSRGTVITPPTGDFSLVRVRWDETDELLWSRTSDLEALTALDLIAEELERPEAADCE